MHPMNFRIYYRSSNASSFYQKMICRKPNYDMTPYIDAMRVSFHDRTLYDRLHYTRKYLSCTISNCGFFLLAVYLESGNYSVQAARFFPNTMGCVLGVVTKLTQSRYHAAGTTYRWNWLGSYVTASAAVASSSEEGAEFRI